MAQVSTGLRQGDFTMLRVLSGGSFVDILSLINQAGGSGTGGGTVTSATLPLSISNGVLSIGEFTTVSLEDQNSTVRVLSPNTTGQLLYNSIMLVDMQTLQQNLANFVSNAVLASQMSGKVDNSRVLTDVPSGALFTDTLYVHPTQHAIADVAGLQTELNAKQPLLTAGSNITIANNVIQAVQERRRHGYPAIFCPLLIL